MKLCYASINSEILRFARSTSDINTFLKFSSRHLERMQKQGRFIIFIVEQYLWQTFQCFKGFSSHSRKLYKVFSLRRSGAVCIHFFLSNNFLFACLFIFFTSKLVMMSISFLDKYFFLSVYFYWCTFYLLINLFISPCIYLFIYWFLYTYMYDL